MITPRPTEFYDLSNWVVQSWLVPTIGSRNKSFVEDPTSRSLYFFKESKQTYPSEFWSEIIASKVGYVLGFDLLDYNIAVLNNRPGCISKKMHDDGFFQDLIHGVNILKEKVPGFIISTRPVISIQEIIKAFEGDKQLKNFVTPMIETIIFDAIIGNTDRHTENWGIIRAFDFDKFIIETMPNTKWYQKVILRVVRSIVARFEKQSEFSYTFTPIFDSGSCLGREIPENLLQGFINKRSLDKYIDKGWHEIRWDGNKLNSFELIKNIRGIRKSVVDKTIKRTLRNFNAHTIEKIINEVDLNVPPQFGNAKLTLHRKELIKQLIFSRVERLRLII